MVLVSYMIFLSNQEKNMCMNTLKRILIAIEDGPTATKVALKGFELGKQLKAEIAVIGVVDTNLMTGDSGMTPQQMSQMLKNSLEARQNILIDKVFKPFKVSSFIEEGDPYKVILTTANEWEADIIVLGTHGRKGLSHLLMGSVAEKTIRHASKPLFIIPTK